MKSQPLVLLFILSLLVLACKPTESIENVKAETMILHDQVMETHSKIIGNQMKIDTLLHSLAEIKLRTPEIDTAMEKSKLIKIRASLLKAEDSMNDWMHNYKADSTNSSDQALLKYFKAERNKISEVEKLYQREIKQSDTYLSKFKKS